LNDIYFDPYVIHILATHYYFNDIDNNNHINDIAALLHVQDKT